MKTHQALKLNQQTEVDQQIIFFEHTYKQLKAIFFFFFFEQLPEIEE